MNIIEIEACVTTLSEAIQAQKAGATRIELCEDIAADGITPSKQLIRSCIDKLNIPIKILIRPRGGNFVYTEDEVKAMETSIAYCKSQGISEVVIGALQPDNQLDLSVISRLAAQAAPMRVSIHKAIDETPDLITSTMALCSIDHISGILTSGGQPRAIDGAATIKNMIATSEGRLEITSAGKITYENINMLHKLIQGTAYHGRRIVDIGL